MPRKRPSTSPRALAQAFASFTQVAGSLENSYAYLQGEIGRLRQELEQSNGDLARTRAFLGRILESLPCGVLVFDSARRLRMANPEAQHLLGAELLDRILEEFSAAEGSAEREWAAGSAEDRRCLGVTRTELPDGILFLVRDLSEAKRLEEAREQGRRMQALAEMAMLLAHEIRNPLGSLELFAGLLADVVDSHPETRQWVDHLQAGLRMVSATVNNVLHFHSQPAPQLTPTPLTRLLRETLEFLRPVARQRGMRIDFAQTVGGTAILAEANRLQQVFFNLALNAFRAMSPGGVLRVSAGWAGPAASAGVEIRFADQGSGIPTEKLANIFEPGYSSYPGSPGLGLAVCRKIVAQHGGGIQVRSVLGQGSEFTLHFPIAGAAA